MVSELQQDSPAQVPTIIAPSIPEPVHTRTDTARTGALPATSIPETPGAGPLDIGTERLCSCPRQHINCLTAKEWITSQLGVWKFAYESRDVRNKSLHPATFPIALAKQCISLFTHEGELVLDPFAGSGTTLVAAQDLNRNGVGFDLKHGLRGAEQFAVG